MRSRLSEFLSARCGRPPSDWLRLKHWATREGHSFPTAWASQRFLNKLLFGPLAHTKDTAGAPQCQSCPTRTQSPPSKKKKKKKTCLLSFIKCLFLSLSFHAHVCGCECVPDSCATCSLWRMTKSKTPVVQATGIFQTVNVTGGGKKKRGKIRLQDVSKRTFLFDFQRTWAAS